MTSPLLHMTTAAPWRMALDVDSLVTPSLLDEGFIHLSTPEQVHLPANRIFAGRDDLVLLVIDPARIRDEILWEPGDPTDPESMRFPHLYGPLPVAAVTSVVPWRPGPRGFEPPVDVPGPADHAARARAFDLSLSRRRAALVIEVDGGFVVLDPRVGASHEHNCVWLFGEHSAGHIRAVAEEALSGCAHRRVVLDRPPPSDLGWEVEEERLMVLDPQSATAPPSAVPVTSVAHEVIGEFWRSQWRESVPGVVEAEIDDLIAREPLADAHVRVIDLAVLDDGSPVASAQLRMDGATAALEAVMTRADHQGRGLASAVVQDAADRARRAGCDLMVLSASAADWPHEWYQRLGFTDVGARWVCTRG